MSVLASTVGYGAGFAARAYFGVSYIHQVQKGLETVFLRVTTPRIGVAVGGFVSKQASYVLAFPCVNLVGEVVSLIAGGIVARIADVALDRFRGKKEPSPHRVALILGVLFAFVVKNTVAFHSLERLHEAIKVGSTRACALYLGDQKRMVGPISAAVGIQAATLAAFPAASLVGDMVGWGVKKVTIRSVSFVIVRLRRPSETSEEGELQTKPADSSQDG